jgi:hypothetical protein
MEAIEKLIKLPCFAGDTMTLAIIVYADATKTTRENIAGHTLDLTVKKSLDDLDADAIFKDSFDPSDAANGLIAAVMTPTETLPLNGDYHFSLVELDGAGNEYTRIYGVLTFRKRAKGTVG